MGAIVGVPLLLAAAKATERNFHAAVSEIIGLMEQHGGQTDLVNGLRLATVQIEVAAIGVFSLFEARMQPCIPKGPFFKQLKALLIEKGQEKLANNVWHYYLAVNVLKHGKGQSYKELCNETHLPFEIKKPDGFFFDEGDVSEPEGLINVIAEDFFVNLIQTLEAVHAYLEQG